jgi:D-alanyl-D-alanine carboxypeptidase
MRSHFVASILLPAAVTLSALTATADRIKTSCYTDPQGNVQGTNLDTLTEIASVSKLLTTHWAVSKLGAAAKIKTLVHVTPVGTNLVDVHIQGGLDPSFNRARLAVIAGHLNTLGITHIRNLTFDQNFRYRDAIYAGPQVASDPRLFVATKNEISPLLRQTITSISSIYQTTLNSEPRLTANELPAQVTLKVDDIHFLDASSFAKTAETVSYRSKSISLAAMIKQMNIKSNNYIANILFDLLGGEAAYREFLKQKFNFGSAQVNFANGSGYPIGNYRQQGRFDNKATCRSIVTIARDLRNQMTSQNMKFADVVAVAGDDAGATVDIYATDLMEGALAAKTGTINPVVALAGLASTVQGHVYFAVVVADGRAGGPARSGRQLIRQQVENMFNKYGGSDEIEYQAASFFSVDDDAKLEKEVTAQVLN